MTIEQDPWIGVVILGIMYTFFGFCVWCLAKYT